MLSDPLSQVLFIQRRFDEVSDRAKSLLTQEVVDKSRREYSVGLDGLCQWLHRNEQLLQEKLPCTHAAVREHVQYLDVSNQIVRRGHMLTGIREHSVNEGKVCRCNIQLLSITASVAM